MITPIRQNEPLRHIDHAAALSLIQSLHRHLEPDAAIRILWGHAATLTRATGLRYVHADRGLDLEFGDGRHSASYTLSHHGESLGEITLRFQRRVDEHILGTAEDLLALAMPALRNSLTYHDACLRAERAELEHRTDQKRPAEESKVLPLPVRPSVRPLPETASGDGARSDSLVLVSLDGFDDIRTAHGEAWAQTLVQSIQSQVHEGLRDADSVFQIDEGLLAVLLPHTGEDAAMDVAAKIRVLIAGLHLRDGGVTSQLTACMGVVGARNAGSPEDVLDQARAALSQAQQEGSSSICAYRAEL